MESTPTSPSRPIPTKRATVLPEDVQVGSPAPFDIEDAYGHLLLRRGGLIESEAQRERLLQIGRTPYHVAVKRHGSGSVSKRRNDPNAPFLNPFDEIYRISLTLQESFRWLGHDRFLRRLDLLISRIGNVLEHDAEASIGAAHLDEEFPYAIRHPIRKAMLCDTVAARIGIPDSERRSIVCAALTANLGMLEEQKQLDRQSTPLSDEQWELIQNHPHRSVERLLDAGLTDRLCLRIVAEHHERLDGSGYPEGLKAQDICRGARLLAIADTYMAMVTDRGYRPATAVRETLLELLNQSGSKYDRDLLADFIHTIGIYPAGSFVALDSGERGVVIHRGSRGSSPMIAVLIKRNGQPVARPLFRDTSLKGMPSIASLEPTPEVARRYPLASLWGYETQTR
ncbi:HD-GYP domain-containing protein [Halorhodospira abdelmalekii]|uniref:HD-GYP domain-containing protein n=1 Tax=Halorhodospira abdelmalekii TaxID=421629 RepID=UPI00190375A9|nr:HD domain-containing phosphohydrolase [Halorhodospira abdelmalekii]